MKQSKQLPDLSKSEIDMMNILWQQGRLSAREVHDQMVETYKWAYSTTKTMLDRMVKKGYLVREKFHGVFLYRPLISRPRGIAKWVQDFADKVLDSDYSSVVALFARNKSLTPEEIDELADLLEKHARRKS